MSEDLAKFQPAERVGDFWGMRYDSFSRLGRQITEFAQLGFKFAKTALSSLVMTQCFLIRVKNDDPVEPHGFTVTHYFDSGVTLRPGETYTLTFLADQKGTFRVYCNIFCTVHVYMQNGRLTVE